MVALAECNLRGVVLAGRLTVNTISWISSTVSEILTFLIEVGDLSVAADACDGVIW